MKSFFFVSAVVAKMFDYKVDLFCFAFSPLAPTFPILNVWFIRQLPLKQELTERADEMRNRRVVKTKTFILSLIQRSRGVESWEPESDDKLQKSTFQPPSDKNTKITPLNSIEYHLWTKLGSKFFWVDYVVKVVPNCKTDSNNTHKSVKCDDEIFSRPRAFAACRSLWHKY